MVDSWTIVCFLRFMAFSFRVRREWNQGKNGAYILGAWKGGRKEGYKDLMVNDLMNAHGWPIERLFEKITSAFTHINAVDGSF